MRTDRINFAIEISKLPVINHKYSRLRKSIINGIYRVVEITDHHGNVLMVIANERKNRYWDNLIVDLNYSSSEEVDKELSIIFNKPEYKYLKDK